MGQASIAGDGDRSEATSLNRAGHTGGSLKTHRHGAAHDIVHRRGRTFVRNMQGIDARALLEHFTCKVGRAACARGGITEFAGVGFGIRDQFCKGLNGKVIVDHQHARGGDELSDRDEVALSVVVQVLVDRHVGRIGDRAEKKRVAIGVGPSRFC